jgi:drug/metabolite transporter (DMT)-like permease
MHQSQKGMVLMIGSALCFAIMYLIFDYLFRTYENYSPGNAFFWGNTGAFLLATPYFWRNKNSRRRLKNCWTHNRSVLIFVSFITTIGAVLWHYSLSQSNSGVITLLAQSDVLFAFLLGLIFLKETVTPMEILSFLGALVGFAFISSLKGEISYFIAGIFLFSRFLYAFQSFCIKKYAHHFDGFYFGYMRSFFMTFFGGIILGIVGKITLVDWIPFFLSSIGLFLSVIVATSLYFETHKIMNISRLNILKFFEPILTLTGAYLVLGDTISGQKFIGALLIIISLLWFTRAQLKRKNEHA